MIAHAKQHGVFADTRCGAQLGRDEDTACAIHLHIHRIAQEDTFPPLRTHRQCGNAFAELLPLGARKEHQTTMGVTRDRELPSRSRAQDVAMPGWHRQTTFGVETQR